MNKISKYQENISQWLKIKSCFAKSIKDNKVFDDIVNMSDHITPIILLTILHQKQRKKAQHGCYMASGIDIMMILVNITDNELYYNTKFGASNILDFVTEMPIHIFKSLSQNIETIENNVDKDSLFKVLKIFHIATTHLQQKLIKIIQKPNITGVQNVVKTDIIKFHFNNKQIINNKYKHLKKIDKDVLLNYVDQKYGQVCQISFIMGWLFGLGEEKMIGNLEKVGSYMGIILKIANDFNNLERDMEYSNNFSYNLIINYGIHECFALFIDNKIKLLHGCIAMNIFTSTMKEIVDHVEQKFDDCLKNTDIELKSVYSSFTDESKKE